MPLLPLIIAGALSILAWVYLLFLRGSFWRIGDLTRPAASIRPTDRIAVIIPARDEAGVIGESIGSLLRQSCAASLRVYVVDDSSTDETTQAAQAAAQESRPGWLTVIEAEAVPPGWSGKLWAVQQGIDHAIRVGPKFLLLTDADVHHAPDSVATLVGIAEAGDYDLTSMMVKLHCKGFAEKLLIPAFVFFFFKLYPPAWVADPRRATAGAAGGCMMIRPEALTRIGGIQVIRSEIIDDCALARAVKISGGKVWLGLASRTKSLRPYGSFAEIGRMIARTAFNQLRHSTLTLIAALIGLALVYLLPVALVATMQPLLVVIGAVAWAMMFVAYLPMVRFFGLKPLWALLLPVAALFYMGATVLSAFRYWSGRGGEWKGRAQDHR